ncbi:MAG TPA: SAM-dependent methyltransferase [Steroidobacteraceae bacterium]|nr:SAM-dependent methyltransferase [Steroidobacteraceae bacterium]
MNDSLIKDVSDTAFWIAHYRAEETARKDGLFRDPFAARLAGEHGAQIAATMPRSEMIAWTVVLRTKIIDDYILNAIQSGVDTILCLGAGLDARPYRMELPADLHWIEADYPKVIEYKEERLSSEAPRCRLERVKIDLADADARREFLSKVDASAKKCLVLTEGVIPYLTEEQVASLADDLRAMQHTQYWITEYFSPLMQAMRRRWKTGMMRNAPFRFEPREWFSFFRQHGWGPKEIRYFAQEGQRYRRWPASSLPRRLVWIVMGVLASKERRDAMQKMAGYLLMERI